MKLLFPQQLAHLGSCAWPLASSIVECCSVIGESGEMETSSGLREEKRRGVSASLHLSPSALFLLEGDGNVLPLQISHVHLSTIFLLIYVCTHILC